MSLLYISVAREENDISLMLGMAPEVARVRTLAGIESRALVVPLLLPMFVVNRRWLS